MPVILPSTLSTLTDLRCSGLDVLADTSPAARQARPLRVALLNLMPGKKATERQFVQLLADSRHPVALTLLRADKPESRELAHEDWRDAAYLRHYRPVSSAWGERYDALIVTGAPVGQKRFEDVTFWPELCRTYDWAREHVGTTLNICWAAVAALKHFHEVERTLEENKLFGVYPQQVWSPGDPLVAGLEDGFPTPVSRFSTVNPKQVKYIGRVEVLAANPVTGLGLVRDKGNRQILAFNHLEYSRGTLGREYERDCGEGLAPALPYNYFPGDDLARDPVHTWQYARHIFAANWVEEVASLARAAPVQPAQVVTMFQHRRASSVVAPQLAAAM